MLIKIQNNISQKFHFWTQMCYKSVGKITEQCFLDKVFGLLSWKFVIENNEASNPTGSVEEDEILVLWYNTLRKSLQ